MSGAQEDEDVEPEAPSGDSSIEDAVDEESSVFVDSLSATSEESDAAHKEAPTHPARSEVADDSSTP